MIWPRSSTARLTSMRFTELLMRDGCVVELQPN
jgi:hypothetical protein